MTTGYVVSLDQVCRHFNIEMEIMSGFAEFGLFPVIREDGETAIEMRNLERLTEIVSLHQALGINTEGIEVILNLRGRINRLQDEVGYLQSTVENLKYHLNNGGPEELHRLGLLVDSVDF